MGEILYLILMIVLFFLWMFSLLVLGAKRAKEKEKKTERIFKIDDVKMEIMYCAYNVSNNFYKFTTFFKDAPEEVFSDQRIVKVIKEEIKRNFNNIYDFSTIKRSIEKLPKENKLLFELIFIQVLNEIDKQFLINLHRQAVKSKEQEVKEYLEKVFKNINLAV